jgi:putative copper resistance protein D
MRAAAAGGAVACAVIVLSPPFDRLADGSFAWHMAQHMVLLFIVPLLAVLADPFHAFMRVAGKRRTAGFVRATEGLRVIASPPVALAIFVAALWGSHFSPLYEASLEHEWIHVGEHALFLFAGTVFWLPVLAPAPVRPVSFPARLLYLFIALPQGALLGAALTSARTPLYPHYAAATSVAHALADQSNAAAIMWIGGGLILLTALLATFGAWAMRERRALQHV